MDALETELRMPDRHWNSTSTTSRTRLRRSCFKRGARPWCLPAWWRLKLRYPGKL